MAVNTKPPSSSSDSFGVGGLGISGARGMADGGLDASRFMLRDLCEYTEPCRRGADENAFKEVPNDEAGLKLPVVDGGRVLEVDPNGEKASKSDNVVVGGGSSTSGSSSMLVLDFLHLAKGLNRLVHCLGSGSESQTEEADERKDLKEWRSFITAWINNNNSAKKKPTIGDAPRQPSSSKLQRSRRGEREEETSFKLRSACRSRRTTQLRLLSAEKPGPLPRTRR